MAMTTKFIEGAEHRVFSRCGWSSYDQPCAHCGENIPAFKDHPSVTLMRIERGRNRPQSSTDYCSHACASAAEPEIAR